MYKIIQYLRNNEKVNTPAKSSEQKQENRRISKQQFRMRHLEDLDPSSIDQIEFNIKSVKKYTSIFTIVLSLAIIVLSIVINAESLSHIYNLRKDLPVTSAKFKDTDVRLSDQPICIGYPDSYTIHPTISIYNTIDQTTTSIPQASLYDFPYMKSHLSSQASKCYNLKGNQLTRNTRIQISCPFPPGAKVYIGAHSIQTVLNEQDPEVVTIDESNWVTQMKTTALMSANMFVLKEKLLVNYQPTVLYTLSKEISTIFCTYIPTPETMIELYFNGQYLSDHENFMGNSYTIIRNNIAQILGGVLAWRGLILIPIALMLMLFPIVQKFYKFDLIKARLQSDLISRTNFNILTDLKRKLAKCCPSRFREQRIINKALQKIDDELDLIAILQMQSVMRRQRAEFGQIEREEDIFDCKIQEKDIKMDILLEHGDQRNGKQATQGSLAVIKNQQIFLKNEQPKRSPILQLLKSFVYSFDDTQTHVSISTNQGKGYGSIWSFCSFVLLAAAIVICLLMLGVFNVKADADQYSGTPLDPDQQTISVEAYTVAIRYDFQMFEKVPKAYLVDQKDNILQEVTFSNNSQCAAVAVQWKAVATDKWWCNTQQFTISSVQSNVAKLKLMPHYFVPVLDFWKTIQTTQTLVISSKPQDNNLSEYTLFYQHGLAVTYTLRKYIRTLDDDRSDGYELVDVDQKLASGSDAITYITVGNQYLLKEDSSGSYWSIFDDSWGIAIIVCDLILFRIGRLINVKILSSKVNTEKQEKRSDILTVLFDIDRLSKGIYKEELSSVGFYYKYKLPIESS